MTTVQIIALIAAGALLILAFADDLTRPLQRQARSLRSRYGKYLNRSLFVQPAIFGLLAVLMRDWVLTSFLLAAGGLIAYYRIRQSMRKANEIQVRQVLQLVVSFRGAFYLRPAVFTALEEAGKRIEGALKELVRIAVESYFITSSPQRAFDEFRKRTDNILLHQFAYILEMGEETSSETMLQVLDSFLARLRSHEDLERQVETGLAGVMSEIRFMQGAFIFVMIVVAVVPVLRSGWTTLLGRMFYIILVSIAIAASYYIERQILRLKEQIQ